MADAAMPFVMEAVEEPTTYIPRIKRGRIMDVTISVVLPFLIFFLCTCLFLFTYHDMKMTVWYLVGGCGALSLLFLLIGACLKHSTFVALGLLCAISVTGGTLFGNWMHERYLVRYWQLTTGMEYKDVDPSAFPGTTADGSVLHFVRGTIVDDRATIGFEAAGSMYCVAPVVYGLMPNAPRGYWAVGEDCCRQRSEFDCGTAREAGGADTAVVEWDDVHFREAIQEAESVYGLESLGNDTQLLRFVSSPQAVVADLWEQALTVALVALLMELGVCAIAGMMVAKMLPAVGNRDTGMVDLDRP